MFYPGEMWADTDGHHIQAHGGGVLFDGGTYYWYGENRAAPNEHSGRVGVVGVSCYSSQDLVQWKNEGLVLPAVPDDPTHDLHPSKVAERPKVIFNAQTKQYVLWLHIDTADYAYARAGCAVSDSPIGPFRYLGSVAPLDSDSRDMTLFQDTDGAAYLYFSSDMNQTLKIVRLSDDYLSLTDISEAAFVGLAREAPAVFTHGGIYYIITSACTGWAANEAEYAVAPSPLGPWDIQGNPAEGPGADKTFESQSAFVLPVAGRPGAFIYLGDRWNPENLADSRYVWLPLSVNGDQISMTWCDSWDLSEFDTL